MTIETTAGHLRELVSDVIASTIDLHRESRLQDAGSGYQKPDGPPTDEEIDDFILTNPLFDPDLASQLTDPWLLGFYAKNAKASDDWLQVFRSHIEQWANTNSWQGADLDYIHVEGIGTIPDETELWTPDSSIQPPWFTATPTCLLVAKELLQTGRLLSEMGWRQFEELIGTLLEERGWSVQVTKQTRDGGIDVIASMSDEILGPIKSVWQAKKYRASNKVKFRDVRELSAVRYENRATKGIIVTTSHLTKDAIDWVRRDQFRLGYKDAEQLERWIKGIDLDDQIQR